MTLVISFFVRLYMGFFSVIQRMTEGWLLGLAARFVFAAVLLVYFVRSALTKFGPGIAGLFEPTAGAYAQILPAMMEAVSYDTSQIPFMPYGLVVLVGSWAEILLPVMIVLGVFTRAASLGFIIFVGAMTYVDITGHHLDAATIGTIFDGDPTGLIADQRLLWVFLLLVLVLRGAGKISLDYLLVRWWYARQY
ncbi:DoxX family membrane protein [Stappia sp. F7233]|uniref:DoxX family membrane protein n=1 Tax=Stappia albiluteola TaxID=2758565 RepID=A0A839AEF3_9HYPH|nr:DoxX family membrane protein [Stappia albiluteola]MBA5777334.1 DoxX family membrane protein [Stappia albiluteola]